MKKSLFPITLALVLSACASSVKSIDLHDPNVPMDARRFIADAQDAVSISRARLDDAREQYDYAVQWREELTAREMWPKGSETVLSKLEEFADARVEMARLQRVRAEVDLELAEAKYTLTTAETAMRNDIAVYELEPLRATAESTRQRLESTNVRIEEHRAALDKTTQQWWKTYGEFASQKDVPAFYMSPEILKASKEREQQARKARDEKKKTEKKTEKGEAKVSEDGKIKLGL